MILLEEANHVIGLVDLHMAVALWSMTWWGCSFNYVGQGINGGDLSGSLIKELMEKIAGQGDNEGEWRNFCRLTTSVNYNSRRNRSTQLSLARTKELDLGERSKWAAERDGSAARRDRRADRRILLKAGDAGMEVELALGRMPSMRDTLKRSQHNMR
jgi:hypothetical protein